jgi:hypothetical protein
VDLEELRALVRREASSSSERERPSRRAGSWKAGDSEEGVVPGKYGGMERPEERKKSRGEAKGSKALTGDGKRWVLRIWRVLMSHTSGPVDMRAGPSVDLGGGEGARDVAT